MRADQCHDQRASQGSVLCTSEIDGNATFSGNGTLVQIGADTPVSGCGFNAFGANVNLTGNAAEIRFSGNVVRGDLACEGNDPAPVGQDNRIRGELLGQCAELSAPAPQKRAMASPAEPEARKASIQRKIEQRTSISETAAQQAGRAFR